MMWIIITIAVLLLMAGPLRKPMFSAWKTTLPLIIGGIVGFVIVNKFMPGAPPWMMIVGPIFTALFIGEALKEGFDDIQGPPKKR